MTAEMTDQQLAEIRDRLAEGMTPNEIANYFGRIADLDLIEIEQVRTAANELEQEQQQGRNP